MRTWSILNRSLIRATLAGGAVVGLLLVGVLRVSAAGNGASTFTVTVKDATFPFGVVTNPCTGAQDVLTLTNVNGVLHITVNKAGDEWDTGTLAGSFTLDPAPPPANPTLGLPSYSGHAETWFGDSFNQTNQVNHAIFNLHGTGSDGSSLTVHMLFHYSTNANGTITVSTNNTSFTCG